jgi:ABC-type transport system substrate-binding protein
MKQAKWWSAVVVLALLAAACAGPATTTTGGGGATTTGAPGTTGAAPSTTGGGGFEGAAFEPGCDVGTNVSSVVATSATQVVFTLCAPNPAFQQIVAFTPFAIQSSESLEASNGSPLDSPVGTGAYKLDTWERGNQVVMSANPDYWGDPAVVNQLVIRWADQPASRLTELQAGTVDYIPNLAAADIATVEANPNLQAVPSPNPNVLYIGLNNKIAPFDDVKVRQAVAQAIDAQRLVDNFYPVGSEVATHFTPCQIPNGCDGDDWYPFDATAAQGLLAGTAAEGLDVTLYFRDASRPYVGEPVAVANDIAEQLSDNLGWNVTVQVVESGEFIETALAGETYGLFMLGWGADYPHVTNFLDTHFGAAVKNFGTPYPEITGPLEEGATVGDTAAAEPIYTEANNMIKELVPAVPLVHGAIVDAALASLNGANPGPPIGAPQFELMDSGRDNIVFMQNKEPISLYCADESDGESLAVCQQMMDPLLQYDTEGNVVPALATACTANDDSTVWTCDLREGVKFTDGTDFDANDVVFNFNVWLDYTNPLHTGNSQLFFYPSSLLGVANQPATTTTN